MKSWPKRVEVVDVTPRDGLQDAKGELSTEEKIALVRKLSEAGVPRIEVTSFVSPKWVPRMRDAEQVIDGISGVPGLIALIPNVVGFERAAQCKVDEVTYVVSASPEHQVANLRMSLEDSFVQLHEIVKRREKTNMRIRGAISCAFGSPFGEVIRPEEVAAIARRFTEFGVEEISLADTVGIGTPDVLWDVTAAVQDELPDVPIAFHLHDRFEIGQANVTVGLLRGVMTFEAALGGLGGCPFAPNAPGNLDTEKLVRWLNSMGIETGIDLTILEGARENVLMQLSRSPV